VGASGVGSFCGQITQRVLTDPFFFCIIRGKDISMIDRDRTTHRMQELMMPVEQQIMMCDTREDLLMMACAMMQRTHEIFVNELGEDGAQLMYKDFV